MEVFNTVAYQEFSLVHRQENGGLLSLLIGRKGSILQLQDIFSCKVSAGYLYTGNAVVTRFQIENTSLSPTNDLNIVVLERVFLVVHISVLFKRLVH